MTFSLVGKTGPARSRAILYFGHSVIVYGHAEHYFAGACDRAHLADGVSHSRHSVGAFPSAHVEASEAGTAGRRRNQSSASSSVMTVRLLIFRPRSRPELSSAYAVVRPGP